MLHTLLALLRRQQQDLQVFAVGARGALGVQSVVRRPEHAARKHLFTVHVAGEGARLADQFFYHMAVVDPVLGAPRHARHDARLFALETDLHMPR
jgi:hypothetical protein